MAGMENVEPSASGYDGVDISTLFRPLDPGYTIGTGLRVLVWPVPCLTAASGPDTARVGVPPRHRVQNKRSLDQGLFDAASSVMIGSGQPGSRTVLLVVGPRLRRLRMHLVYTVSRAGEVANSPHLFT
jgi:hypothetical protein